MTKEQYEMLREKGGYEALYIDLLNASGFAGCLQNGNIVDRRYRPDAYPIHKNSIFGVVPPKEITACELITEERKKAIEKHGRTIERDVELNNSWQLPYAAQKLSEPIIHEIPIAPSNWDVEVWKKLSSKYYKERLVIAAQFIAAEIDRLIYLEKNYFTCESCGLPILEDEPAIDADDNYFCEECWKELEPVLKAEYEDLKRRGEIE